MGKARKCGVDFLLASMLCVGLVGCGGEEPSIRDPEITAKVAAIFDDYSVDGSPGAAVMVIEDGETRFEGCFGLADIESRTPITPQSAFRLASVSKQFAAMAIMILADRGQLDIDDELTGYLPELERFGDDITVSSPAYPHRRPARLLRRLDGGGRRLDALDRGGDGVPGWLGRTALRGRGSIRVQQPGLRDAGAGR